MPDKFDRLIDDLNRLDSHFELNPCLAEDQVASFESRHRIRLPEDYREFITRVGNGGGLGPTEWFRLGEMDDDLKFTDFIGVLSEPFPHTADWNDLTTLPDDDDVTFEEAYWDRSLMNGAIPFADLGCNRWMYLVVTGPEAGNLWMDERADQNGIFPLQTEEMDRVSFFDWYRQWLVNLLAVQARRRMPRKSIWNRLNSRSFGLFVTLSVLFALFMGWRNTASADWMDTAALLLGGVTLLAFLATLIQLDK